MSIPVGAHGGLSQCIVVLIEAELAEVSVVDDGSRGEGVEGASGRRYGTDEPFGRIARGPGGLCQHYLAVGVGHIVG